MPTPAPTRVSIRTIKHTQYKGGPRQFGTRFFFNQTAAMSAGDAATLAAALITAEKAAYSDGTVWEGWTYYDAGSDVPVHSGTSSGSGGISGTTSGQYSPLEVSGLIRFDTTQRTSKNHPIYLFKYIRGAMRDVSAGLETWWATQKSAAGTFAGTLVTGITVGGVVYKLCGPYGAVAQGHFEEPYTTHRDFPNR